MREFETIPSPKMDTCPAGKNIITDIVTNALLELGGFFHGSPEKLLQLLEFAKSAPEQTYVRYVQHFKSINLATALQEPKRAFSLHIAEDLMQLYRCLHANDELVESLHLSNFYPTIEVTDLVSEIKALTEAFVTQQLSALHQLCNTQFQYMLDTGQLTHKGLYVVHDYYLQKYPNLRGLVTIIHSPKEIRCFVDTAPLPRISAFIVTVSDHKMPVFYRTDNTFLIFDSKGRGAIYSRECASLIREAFGPSATIYYSTPTRQIDMVSCGTDAFMLIKEGLRMGEGLFQFVEEQECEVDIEDNYFIEIIPPQFAKLCQDITSLVRPNAEWGKGLLDKYPHLQTAAIPKNKSAGAPSNSQSTESIMEYVARHRSSVPNSQSNLAVLERREKLRGLINKKIFNSRQTELETIFREASGINRLVEYSQAHVAHATNSTAEPGPVATTSSSLTLPGVPCPIVTTGVQRHIQLAEIETQLMDMQRQYFTSNQVTLFEIQQLISVRAALRCNLDNGQAATSYKPK